MMNMSSRSRTRTRKKTGAAKLCLFCLSLVCLATLLTPTASAVTPKEILRVEQNQLFEGLCCFSWLESVSATEPYTVVPVIVTWSTDYQATDTFIAGLSVNGGPCTLFGPAWFQPFQLADGSGSFDSRYFQWVILPSDGLVNGKNTFTVCGGAFFSPTALILLGTNSLSARTMK